MVFLEHSKTYLSKIIFDKFQSFWPRLKNRQQQNDDQHRSYLNLRLRYKAPFFIFLIVSHL